MLKMERKRPYRQLASVYLAEFAINRPGLEEISGVLRGYALAAGTPWDKLQAKYTIFDGPEAAGRIARLALNERKSVQNVFESAGVSGPLLGGDFARTAHDEGLKIIARTPVSTVAEHVGTVQRWSLQHDKRLISRIAKLRSRTRLWIPSATGSLRPRIAT
jgi:hypothetical protein